MKCQIMEINFLSEYLDKIMDSMAMMNSWVVNVNIEI